MPAINGLWSVLGRGWGATRRENDVLAAGKYRFRSPNGFFSEIFQFFLATHYPYSTMTLRRLKRSHRAADELTMINTVIFQIHPSKHENKLFFWKLSTSHTIFYPFVFPFTDVSVCITHCDTDTVFRFCVSDTKERANIIYRTRYLMCSNISLIGIYVYYNIYCIGRL